MARTNVKTKQSTTSNPAAQTFVGSTRAWLFVSMAAGFMLVSAFGVIYSTYQTRKLIAEFQHLQNQRNELQTAWGQLLLEQSTWGSFNRVERLAIKKLNMRVPDPQQVVMISQ
ncbi:MAG: cell division protein FtsL [Pseudomonadales bacterium]|nr:cell division protein FtsL [Pseudomonadales bacterium]